MRDDHFQFTSHEHCPYCEFLHYNCFILHDGQSVRQDCERCHKTLRFAWWYERSAAISLLPIVDSLRKMPEEAKVPAIQDYLSVRMPIPPGWEVKLLVDRKNGEARLITGKRLQQESEQ